MLYEYTVLIALCLSGSIAGFGGGMILKASSCDKPLVAVLTDIRGPVLMGISSVAFAWLCFWPVFYFGLFHASILLSAAAGTATTLLLSGSGYVLGISTTRTGR